MSQSERDIHHTLIGLAGPSSCGKTTLAAAMEEKFGARIATLSFDEYDLYPPGSELPPVANWEDPRLFDCERYLQDVTQLKAGLPIVLAARSRESIAASGKIENRVFFPQELTLVEGVFAYHNPATRELFDYRVFINIPPEEMIRRRLARSIGSPYPWDDEDYIRNGMVTGTSKFILPQMAHAHLVLDGMLPTLTLADQLYKAIVGIHDKG